MTPRCSCDSDQPPQDVRNGGPLHLMSPVVLVEISLGPFEIQRLLRSLHRIEPLELDPAKLKRIRDGIRFAVVVMVLVVRWKQPLNEGAQRRHRALLPDAVYQHHCLSRTN